MTAALLRASDAAIVPALLILAALNGWGPRLLAENAPAVSLFAPATLAVALMLWPWRPGLPAGDAAPSPGLLAAALLILVPSGAAAWLALAGLAAACAGRGPARGLLLGLAVAELFASVGLNRAKALLRPLEAQAAGVLLSAAGVPVAVEGNVLAIGDRLTVVAAGCSGASGALFAALGAAAILLWRNRCVRWHPVALAGLVAGAVSLAANLLRLAVMAVDADLYAAAHGQWGALVTDLVASAGVAGAVVLVERLAR